MKKIIYKIFQPNIFIKILTYILSVYLLIYVFTMHIEESVLAYAAYPLSTYALILFIIWFIKACNFSSEFIHNTALYKLYKKNKRDILKYSLTITSVINLLYGIFKLITGIYYCSWWFITIAIYYLILCLMKSLVLKNSKSIIRNIGIILLLMNFVLIGIVVLSLRHDYHIIYKDYLIYAVALYDFYLIITAIINVFKYRNDKSEVMVASKYISLVVSMISMLELEIAMIYEFGDDDEFKLIMISITGLVIFIINIILSIRMIYKNSSKN